MLIPDRDMARWGLDEIDVKLIELLEQDGRMSYADLAQAVGLTSGGARARFIRLQERGIIRVNAILTASAVGLHCVAGLQIDVDGSRDIEEIADDIAEFPEVRYLVMGTGNCSLHAEIYVEVSSAIFDLVNRRIKRVPGVGRTEIFFHERVHTIRPILEG